MYNSSWRVLFNLFAARIIYTPRCFGFAKDGFLGVSIPQIGPTEVGLLQIGPTNYKSRKH